MSDGKITRIALIQQAGLSPNKSANVSALLQAIDDVGSTADVICATELSSTPYFAVVHDESLATWAEPLDGGLVAEVAARAKRFETTILLPLFLQSNEDKRENAVIVIGPNGQIVEGTTAAGTTHQYYSKTHLPFSWRNERGLDEPFYFTPGDHYPVFDTPTGKIGVLICYD
ncbi:MAG: nitrilase-related carbon-nitrogen hydrolase, partial [Pseudomonadota bacterium]